MPVVRANDIGIYYEIHGEGDPLILISGLASDHTLYKAIIPRLAEKYKVIAFDNRGVGRTDKPNIPYTIEMMADDTAGLLRELGMKPAHVLGTSLGGRIAVALALRHPELVESLILVSTNVKPPPNNWSRRLMRFTLFIPVLQGALPYYAARHQREAARAFDATDRLQEIRVPTLILHGTKDGSAPYEWAEEVHRGIAGSQIVSFDGGHLFFILRLPQFVAAILDFLSERATGDRHPQP